MRGQVLVVRATGERLLFVEAYGLYVEAGKDERGGWSMTIHRSDEATLIRGEIVTMKDHFRATCQFTSEIIVPDDIGGFIVRTAFVRSTFNDTLISWFEDGVRGGGFPATGLPDIPNEYAELRRKEPEFAEKIHHFLVKAGGLQ